MPALRLYELSVNRALLLMQIHPRSKSKVKKNIRAWALLLNVRAYREDDGETEAIGGRFS